MSGEFWGVFALGALLGGIGGLGFGLLQDSGLELPHPHVDGNVTFWSLGFVAPILIGALAAVIVYGLNPPADPGRFVATALAAGVGGSAILKSYVNGKIAERQTTRAEQLRAGVQGMKDSGVPAAEDMFQGRLGELLSVDADLAKRVP